MILRWQAALPIRIFGNLVEQRFREICAGEPYDYDSHGYMIVMEPVDSVDALEEGSSCPILRNLFDDTHFGHVLIRLVRTTR